MDASLFGIRAQQIKCKADLMKYCLEATAQKSACGDIIAYDMKEAKEMFKFFTRHVKLPDVPPAPEKELYGMLQQLLGKLSDRLESYPVL